MGTIALLLAASAAGCTGDDGPTDRLVAVDDEVVMYAGSTSGTLDPFANDTAPSGTELRMCGRARGSEDGLRYEYYDVAAYLGFDALPSARPGEHEVRYTACAGGERSTATVHVTVLALPEITVTRTSRPGRLRVTNPAGRPIEVYYGLNDEKLPPDGHFEVAPGASRVFRVQREVIDWSAFSLLGDEPRFDLTGQVTGIRLPVGVEPLPVPRWPGTT